MGGILALRRSIWELNTRVLSCRVDVIIHTIVEELARRKGITLSKLFLEFIRKGIKDNLGLVTHADMLDWVQSF